MRHIDIPRIGALGWVLAAVVATSAAAETDRTPLSGFPFPLVEVPGAEALARWEVLIETDGATPVIVGSEEDVLYLSEFADMNRERSVADILAAADRLSHPESLKARASEESRRFEEYMREKGGLSAEDLEEIQKEERQYEAEIASAPWPAVPAVNPGLLALEDYSTGQFLKTVYIAMIPTEDPTEVPAYLKLGGWNANPPPEYHVAALRSWQARFGAVPVVVTDDVIELRVKTRPETRDAAIALAWEQYDYTGDIITQGMGTVPNLAASLMASDWWYFWWD